MLVISTARLSFKVRLVSIPSSFSADDLVLVSLFLGWKIRLKLFATGSALEMKQMPN